MVRVRVKRWLNNLLLLVVVVVVVYVLRIPKIGVYINGIRIRSRQYIQ